MEKQDLKDHPFYAIRDLATKFRNYPSAELNPQELKKLNIEVTPMKIETGDPGTGKNQFCRPISKERFERLLQQHKNDIEWNHWSADYQSSLTADESDSEDWSHNPYGLALNTEHMLMELLREVIGSTESRFRHMKLTPFEYLCWCTPASDEEWQVHGVIEAKNPTEKPHMTALLYENTPPPNFKLRRSELLSACSLMAGKFQNSKVTWRHRVVPVTVCSLSGEQARIIQTYYDPTRKVFVVRASENFTVKEVIDDNSKLLLRWMMNEPCGSVTAYPETPKPRGQSASLPEQTKRLSLGKSTGSH